MEVEKGPPVRITEKRGVLVLLNGRSKEREVWRDEIVAVTGFEGQEKENKTQGDESQGPVQRLPKKKASQKHEQTSIIPSN